MDIVKYLKKIIGIKENKVISKVIPSKKVFDIVVPDFDLFSHCKREELKTINIYPNITELDYMQINKTMEEETTLHFPNCRKVRIISFTQQTEESPKISILLPDDCEVEFIEMLTGKISISCGKIGYIWSKTDWREVTSDLEINKAQYIKEIDVEWFGKLKLNDTIKIGDISCGLGILIAEKVKEVGSVKVNTFGTLNMSNCERIRKELKCKDGEITVKKDCKFEGEVFVYRHGVIKKV